MWLTNWNLVAFQLQIGQLPEEKHARTFFRGRTSMSRGSMVTETVSVKIPA